MCRSDPENFPTQFTIDSRLAGYKMNSPVPAHAEGLYPDVPSAGQNSGGLVVTQEMRDILSQPGYLSLAKGGKKLRGIYMQRKLHSNMYFHTQYMN